MSDDESMSLKVEERPDSCKISINAKGQWSGEVKAYAKTLDEAIEIAKKKAEELTSFIKEKNFQQ